VSARHLFAPAVAQAGLAPDRVIYVRPTNWQSALVKGGNESLDVCNRIFLADRSARPVRDRVLSRKKKGREWRYHGVDSGMWAVALVS
jgi:hypothetical protein